MTNTTAMPATPTPNVTGTRQQAKAPLESTTTSHMTAAQASEITIPVQDTKSTTTPNKGQQEAQEDKEQSEQTATDKTQVAKTMQVDDTSEEADTKQPASEEPTELSPKEWQCKHDLWLHSAM